MLVHWFLRCQCSIFAIYCLTMSNLPWFMDLPFQVPMRYCSSQHQTLLSPPDTSTTEGHFYFAQSFIPSEAIINCPRLFPSSILDTFQTGGFIFWLRIFLPFRTVHGVVCARILKGVAISCVFVRTLHYVLFKALQVEKIPWRRAWPHSQYSCMENPMDRGV